MSIACTTSGCSPSWLLVSIRICDVVVAACPATAGETGGRRAFGGNEAWGAGHGARVMAKSKGKQGHRHPDTVTYLEGLGEEGAAVLRKHEGGYTRYWLEGGDVRSRDITEAELPLAGFRPDGGPLPALLAAVSSEFGPQFPKLAAELASGVPDLDSVERALRDSSLGGGATALKMLFEQFDKALPPPECARCGKPMCRHRAGKKRVWLTRLGRVEIERSYYYCRSCGNGCFPLDRALGLESSTIIPGMASVVAETTPMMSFDAASGHIANLAGLNASSSSLQRWSPGARRGCSPFRARGGRRG